MKKIADLDSLLSTDDLSKSITELDNFVSTICLWGDTLEVLSQTQKNFYFNQCLEREVNRGGFKLFFMNSSGEFAHETVKSLKVIGARRSALILQSAIDEFPRKRVPPNRVERIRTIERMDDRVFEKWKELSQLFTKNKDKDNLNQLNIRFIKKHAHDF